MKIEVRDTIINDEYSVMTKTDDIKKIAKRVSTSPSGVVIVKGRDSEIMGVVTFREIIDVLSSKKDISKLKLKDVMTIKETDNVDRVISRVKRRKPDATIVVNERDQLVGYFSDSDMSYASACQKIMKDMLK